MIVGGLTQILRNHVNAQGGPCKVIPAPFAVNLFAVLGFKTQTATCDNNFLVPAACEDDVVIKYSKDLHR